MDRGQQPWTGRLRGRAVSAVGAACPATARRGCAGTIVTTIVCRGGGVLGPVAGTLNPLHAASGISRAAVSGLFSDLAATVAQAASGLLGELAQVFVRSSTVDLGAAGLGALTKTTLWVGAVLAAVLTVVSMATTAWQRDGSAVATSATGLCRLAFIAASLVTVTQVGLRAADQLSSTIVVRSFGSDRQLGRRLASALTVGSALNPALVLIVSSLAIVTALLLWAEMLLRHVAIVVLVATAPIAAAGLTLHSTGSWWPRLRTALIQLIVLKPLVVFCLAVGFGLAGSAGDLNGVIAALITLALAVFAWPILARFMTFTSVGAGSGLASAVLGGAAGVALGGGRALVAGARPNPGAVAGAGYPREVERQNAGLLSARSGEFGGNGVLLGDAVPARPGSAPPPPGLAAGGPAAVAAVAVAQGARSAARHVVGAVDAMAAHAGLPAGPPAGSLAPPGGRPWGDPT